MKTGLFVCSALLVASAAGAQTHPCDITPNPNISGRGPFRLNVCWNGLDTDGDPIIQAGAHVTIDNTQLDISLTATGQPNATGLTLYQSPIGSIALSKGTHTITASITGRATPTSTTVSGVPSVPFVVNVSSPASAPVVKTPTLQ